ncbi:YIP1 family protein [Ferrimonas pelagia]|uniref:Yip1 domain-containing protein n=1 Tax=Ferrimonas pelagia TaxID=1177826 RepID=A0ABP9EGG5_9GAMM
MSLFSPSSHEPSPQSIAVAFELADGRKSAFPKEPWFAMMLEPRQTLRAILNSASPRRYFWWVLTLPLLISLLEAVLEQSQHMTDVEPLDLIASGAGLLVLLPLLYGFLRLHAWFMRHVGGWLGGRGTTEAIMIGWVWSGIPQILLIPLLLLMALWLALGDAIGASWLSTQGVLFGAFLVLTGVLQLIFLFWSLGLTVINLATAHSFSVWRSIGAHAIALALWCAFLLALVFGFGLHHGMGQHVF